ncbi:PadR family transcriptional regulator [Desulfosporosinus sp. BG]|uniref:PadR family transcriptional regulator n=1 Tax=Desulfosporosinus sp. BG TaxID=1633135 RepID=UPI00083AD186|nr:PadR family transcriptional regulator [Desulfosporosinus sp. BG]ODA40637.1 Transcriptional regulator, PadR family [Desulfosporosinus sp. BG]
MNKLSYGLLSLLSIMPQTGYDLLLSLNRFWHTNHSAIYPLLAELEEKGYARYTSIDQQGKPDKKIYSITEDGMTALKKWIVSPLEDAVIKDEMILKAFCIEIFDYATVEILLEQIEARYQKQLERYKKYLKDMQTNVNSKAEPINNLILGGYILIQKGIIDAQSGIKWCRWIRNLYDKHETFDFTIIDFEKIMD